MYFFEGNFSSSEGSIFSGGLSKVRNIKIATVIKTGIVPVNTSNDAQRKRDERFNSDPYIIRCRIVGQNSDNPITDDLLPNCFPLMPKHNAIIPKEKEIVLILEFGDEGDRHPDRFYIGPLISSLNYLNKQTLYGGATSGLNISPTGTMFNINTVPETQGIFSEYDRDYGYSIDGRDNCDIVFKSSEVLLRAGKFNGKSDDMTLNQTNPAYIQIKHGFIQAKQNGAPVLSTKAGCSAFGGCGGSTAISGDKISATNIVANKINLLTYGPDADPLFNLTRRDNQNSKTPYIDDAELNKILETAHPLVFGDVLMEYLKLLETAFLNHNHNHLGLSTPIQKNPVIECFVRDAPKLREKMLSKNIKIN